MLFARLPLMANRVSPTWRMTFDWFETTTPQTPSTHPSSLNLHASPWLQAKQQTEIFSPVFVTFNGSIFCNKSIYNKSK
jgi:hypothetical protein